jgi:hypothetical protein
MPITLDRQSETWALLVLTNGDQYDCYGDTWAEIKASALEIADWLGVTIETFNSEIPTE